MKLPWFRQVGIFFFPKNIAGWIVLFAALVFAVYKFMDIDSRSHSASDTLINFVFYLIIIGMVYSFIGFLASREAKSK
jgi:putative effector of murein hydrolase LrgA (UPF0299 family)